MLYDVDPPTHSRTFLDLLGTTSLMLQMVLSGQLWRMVLGTRPLDPDRNDIGHVARAISDYLTPETGVTTILESAIVNGGNHPVNHTIDDGGDSSDKYRNSDEDIKWSMFYLNVDSIDITLTLWQWLDLGLDGKGDAVIKGVRGVLDRRSVRWSPVLDPASFRHIAQQGDFELESLTLEDVLVTVYQPGGFWPYTFSIFRADFGTLRKQWLFYDFLKAEGIVGQFDNCPFSLHRPQSIGKTNEQGGGWSMMIQSRFRIDGVNIDHHQAMTTDEGPIFWISLLDIKFPRPTPTP
ncbi:mitochondrial distribution and morphology proteins-domain-containing protein [Lactarius sanguifluus]|nr:mitochondrial distribution and morphology proteins-domain-containing protein [Lactarius sanguifluus]